MYKKIEIFGTPKFYWSPYGCRVKKNRNFWSFKVLLDFLLRKKKKRREKKWDTWKSAL